MTLTYDPEYHKATAEFFAASSGPQPAVHDVAARRKNITAAYEAMFEKLPLVTDVEHSVYEVKSYDGHTIKVHRFSKKSSTPATAGPAILHAHGGGTIQGDVALFVKPLSIQVHQTGVQVFSVDYRLAPENTHPTPVEDCYAGLTWLYEHADEFAVDRSRIATMGESAGGLLAAGITLMARDRGLNPRIAKQILIYPMLDDRNTTPNPALEPFALWNCTDNITAWTALLGDAIGKDHASQYAAPARAVSVQGLPTTYIDVGELDIFRDEDIAYAARIAAANISVELHVYPGLPHAFEVYAPDIDATRRATADRLRAIRTL
ncbi:alpha/beta hydrolase [Aspergillus clavatus NRRL 1]|uniref:Arylesterase/monoxygenase n=1 Tax=Aspergillus clavatus (strain ATCC 1007 / CBS 513.65 / DSM 816 / NCTC 3887 / NRRL 1 / QM 1276 / 107) TaxID=344612 RepID=A1C6Y3_ASPCL|nr:arylesterase/monooxygenase [Aspergillus clavatus NRRL 1]EAW14154.1 arylesterase/monoxygenase [Aspergillus clavatus NRRL 1]